MGLEATPRSRRRRAIVATMGLVVCAGGLVWGQSARSTVPPARGILLVAHPRIPEGPFHESVVLLLDHEDESGTLGVIVNRATHVPLTEVLPEKEKALTEVHSLFFGGPVALSGLICVFRSEEPPETSNRVMRDVYFTGDKRALDGLLESKQPQDRFRVYFGYAGWAPGQLKSEIARGDWYLLKGDPQTVFEHKPNELWKELLQKVQGTLVADG